MTDPSTLPPDLSPTDEYEALCDARRRRARRRIARLCVAWLVLHVGGIALFILGVRLGRDLGWTIAILSGGAVAWLLAIAAAFAAAWTALSHRGLLAGGWTALGLLPGILLLGEMLLLIPATLFGI